MRRPAIALILLVIFVGSFAHAIEATGSYEDAKALAAQHNKPLLVEFLTIW